MTVHYRLQRPSWSWSYATN